MRRVVWLCLLLLPFASHAVVPSREVVIAGNADRDIPAWTIHTVAPEGWTRDCCVYAQAIGVNEVLYKGDWTGEPERVMVFNVWTSKLSSLEAELQDDRHRYLGRDPGGKVQVFALDRPAVNCRGVLYEGTDHKDDVVVFCDPGLASGIRFSWSMTLAHDDGEKTQLLSLFREVAEQTRYNLSHGGTAKPVH